MFQHRFAHHQAVMTMIEMTPHEGATIIRHHLDRNAAVFDGLKNVDTIEMAGVGPPNPHG